jgi:hypothetical protein
VILCPNHNEADLREYNDCHNPAGPGGGQFCGKSFRVPGQGRALGVAARRAARLAHERFERDVFDAETEQNIQYRIRQTTSIGHKNDPKLDAEYAQRVRDQEAYQRRAALRDVRHERADAKQGWSALRTPASIPKWMQRDVSQAWKTDRVVVQYHDTPGEGEGLHYPRTRIVKVSPTANPSLPYGTKPEQLSVLRHELGHADKTELGRGGRIIGGEKFRGQYVEEWRAWKNAIRNSGGKVDFKTVRSSLRSYLDDQPVSPAAYDYVVNRHVAILKRYAKRVRRASK